MINQFLKSTHQVRLLTIKFADVVTWAGESPNPNEFAFATEGGHLHFTGIRSRLDDPRTTRIATAEDTVNGVAFAEHGDQRFVAASTRSGLFINRFSLANTYLGTQALGLGTHGVFPTAWGGFLTSHGQDGLGSYHFEDDKIRYDGLRGRDRSPYFYIPTSLGVHGVQEVWVVPCRTDGLSFVDLDRSGALSLRRATRFTRERVDFIGAAPVGDPAIPRGVFAIGINGSIHLIRDFLSDHETVSLQIPHLPGKAYKFLCIGGHGLLHTSRGVFLIPNLVSRFVNSKDTSPIEVNKYLEDAVDCFIAYNEWVLMLTSKYVTLGSIPELLGTHDRHNRPNQIIGRESCSSSGTLTDYTDHDGPLFSESMFLESPSVALW